MIGTVLALPFGVGLLWLLYRWVTWRVDAWLARRRERARLELSAASVNLTPLPGETNGHLRARIERAVFTPPGRVDEDLLKLVAMQAHHDIGRAFVSRQGPAIVVVTVTTRLGSRVPDFVVALAQMALDRHTPAGFELVARSIEVRIADMVS